MWYDLTPRPGFVLEAIIPLLNYCNLPQLPPDKVFDCFHFINDNNYFIATFAFLVSTVNGVNNTNYRSYKQLIHNDIPVVADRTCLQYNPMSNIVCYGYTYILELIRRSHIKQALLQELSSRGITGKYNDFTDDLDLIPVRLHYMHCIRLDGNILHRGGLPEAYDFDHNPAAVDGGDALSKPNKGASSRAGMHTEEEEEGSDEEVQTGSKQVLIYLRRMRGFIVYRPSGDVVNEPVLNATGIVHGKLEEFIDESKWYMFQWTDRYK